MNILKKKSLFVTKNSKLEIIKYLGKGKSGYSYLTKDNTSRYVLKIMHEEKCSYYNFSKSKVELELKAYQILNKYNIPVPKLYEWNNEKQYLVKEYIDGQLASEVIANDSIDSYILEKLFRISNLISNAGYNIDYFPNNFVIKGIDIFYIDYEINEYDEKWNFQNWGLFYWLNSTGFKEFLEKGDAKFINSDLERGIPIKEPFLVISKQLIEKYSKQQLIK